MDLGLLEEEFDALKARVNALEHQVENIARLLNKVVAYLDKRDHVYIELE